MPAHVAMQAASQGTGDEGLPKIDTHWLEPMQYQFRRARTEQIAKAAASAGHNQSLAGFKDILKSVVKSVSVPYVLKVRYPAPEELVMPREYSK